MRLRKMIVVWGAVAFIGATLVACDVVSLDPGNPDMSIKLDTTDFERGGEGSVWVSFLIENRGTGVAYLEGCPDPVPMVIERMDVEWVVHDELNTECAGDAAKQALAGLKAYRYQYLETSAGRYRFNVKYGDKEDDPAQLTVSSPEFSVQ